MTSCSPGGKQLVMLDSTLNQPNGIVGTPDGKHLYVAEAKANRILWSKMMKMLWQKNRLNPI